MRRVIAWVARMASYFLFRRVEVVGGDTLVRGRPTLLVANHFNGFVDPVVIAMAVGRLPRFIAKATLTDIPGLGTLMRSVGVVFVQRRQDGEGTDNRSAFHECHAALAKGDIVGIFPEGTTHDRPRLDPIRTGAARIILGVEAGEGPPPVVVPVGLTYPDKLAVRSSVLVQFGAPIDPAEVVGGDADESDHQAVRDLTGAIHDGLRSVSPDFDDLEDRLTFELGAEIATRNQQGEGTLIDRARAARRVADASDDEQASVRDAVGRYAALLTALRLTDAEVAHAPTARAVLRAAVVAGLWVALLGSFVVSTALVNVVPVGLVLVASLRTKTPVTKGTVRVLVGLVAFPVAWVTGGVIAVDGVLPVMAASTVMALGAVAALALVERAVLFARALMAWYVTSERAAAVDALRRQREQVIEALAEV